MENFNKTRIRRLVTVRLTNLPQFNPANSILFVGYIFYKILSLSHAARNLYTKFTLAHNGNLFVSFLYDTL